MTDSKKAFAPKKTKAAQPQLELLVYSGANKAMEFDGRKLMKGDTIRARPGVAAQLREMVCFSDPKKKE